MGRIDKIKASGKLIEGKLQSLAGYATDDLDLYLEGKAKEMQAGWMRTTADIKDAASNLAHGVKKTMDKTVDRATKAIDHVTKQI
mgnify:CR=1 FL=1